MTSHSADSQLCELRESLRGMLDGSVRSSTIRLKELSRELGIKTFRVSPVSNKMEISPNKNPTHTSLNKDKIFKGEAWIEMVVSLATTDSTNFIEARPDLMVRSINELQADSLLKVSSRA